MREQVLLEQYYKNYPQRSKNKTEKYFQWSGTQVKFVALIYSLHDAGSINNGSTSLKELLSGLGEIFNLLINRFHHPHQIAAPDFGNICIGITSANQFHCDLRKFVSCSQSFDAAAAIEV